MTNNSNLLQSVFQTVVNRVGISELTENKRKQNVLKNICSCRTEKSAIVSSSCPECGYEVFHHASCNDSCCPICGEAKRKLWAEYESQYILDCPYYHIVFTVPDLLNPLFLLVPRAMYNLLFKASSEALNQMGRDEKHLGAQQMGYMMMLHTWGSNMSLHPHIHCLCAGCGLDKK